MPTIDCSKQPLRIGPDMRKEDQERMLESLPEGSVVKQLIGAGNKLAKEDE